MSILQEVDAKTYKEKTEEWLAHYAKYTEELVNINKAEHEEIETIKLEKFTEKFDEFVSKFPERATMYEEQRKKLKVIYGYYSSLHYCPYYCVVHSKEELDELTPENKRGEYSNYAFHLNGLENFTSGKLYARYTKKLMNIDVFCSTMPSYDI